MKQQRQITKTGFTRTTMPRSSDRESYRVAAAKSDNAPTVSPDIIGVRSWNGFTLIEMMVVLTLIGILAVVAATNYFTSLARARDARRKSDIRLLQSALEQYNTLCGGVYPTPQGSFYTSVSCSNVGTILGAVPTDPGTTPYACPTPLASNCTGTKYTICATLEKETPSGFCLGNSQ